jgi:hypothetical protein
VSDRFMRLLTGFLGLVALVSCHCEGTESRAGVVGAASAAAPAVRKPRLSPAAGVAATPVCPPEVDEAYFFPVGTLGAPRARSSGDISRRKSYSYELLRMREPSLSCGNASQDSFRFTWLRSFHPPVAVRVSLRRDSVELVATEMSASGRAAPDGVVDQPHRRLSPTEWGELEAALARAEFWQLASAIGDTNPDGAQWIVEGRVGSRYHVVDRWGPRGPFRDLGIAFIKVSGLSISELDVY